VDQETTCLFLLLLYFDLEHIEHVKVWLWPDKALSYPSSFRLPLFVLPSLTALLPVKYFLFSPYLSSLLISNPRCRFKEAFTVYSSSSRQTYYLTSLEYSGGYVQKTCDSQKVNWKPQML